MEEIRIIGPYEPVVYHDGTEPSLCATNLNKSENYLKELSEDFLDFSKNTSDKLYEIQNTIIPEKVDKGVLTAKDYTDTKHTAATQYIDQEILTLSDTVDSNKSEFDEHVSATNPHSITKDTVGLGNVENLSSEELRDLFTGDIDKSEDGFITLEDAQNILRQLQQHENTKSNPHEVSAAQVGLDKVENKSVSEIKQDLEGTITEDSDGFVSGSSVFTEIKKIEGITESLSSAIESNATAISNNTQNITTNSNNISNNSSRIEEVHSSIPTKISQLENDSGYLTALDLGDELIFNCGTSR